MRFSFDDFVLDTEARSLDQNGHEVSLEPQVFDLLVVLIEKRHRVVTKDEIVERVWFGRVVSDWTVLGRVKALRRVLGDDGKSQKFIRTFRGKGFRFMADAHLRSEAKASSVESDGLGAYREKGTPPCIAVMPFSVIGQTELAASIAEAVPRELIRSLSSLRSLKVIAHGSSFRFRGQTLEHQQVRSLLAAQYCISGMVEVSNHRLYVDVELADTRSGEVVWATRKDAPVEEVQQLRAEIAAAVLTVSEFELPAHEASLLEIDGAENLDAWAALHLGFKHMYRFNKSDTEIARRMFEQSVKLEPTLARAHAGLSFTSFQRVFLGYSTDMDGDRQFAHDCAEQSVLLQPRDPFANVVMGRSKWLIGDAEASKPWFDRAVHESPNYAFGHYASSWSKVFTGDYAGGNETTDFAMALSPLDPMRGGMLCNKMWIALVDEDFSSAVTWAEKCALTPGAHAGHAMFAAMSHWLNGDEAGVARWQKEMKRRNPDYSQAKARALVPSNHVEFSKLVEKSARALALPE